MDIDTLAKRYFADAHGLDLHDLTAPFDNPPGVGKALAGSSVYSAIRNAREEEDETLPQGAWERELKRADWPAVSRLCLDALMTQGKDLQLAVWLLESEIRLRGFRAVAPCVQLLAMLIENFWPELHPLDIEHRINLFRWVADKLGTPLRLTPFTVAGGEREYGWADWEQAQRNEQIRAALGKDAEHEIEGTTLARFNGALASTPSTNIVAAQDQVAAALSAFKILAETLEPLLDEEAPSFEALRQLFDNIDLMLAAEAKRRGLQRETAAPAPPPAARAEAHGETSSAAPEYGEREQLYYQLSVMAHQLAQIEPHSPVPYLIQRAVAWGGLNTAQLYNEVFVRCGGQINIFELLGLEEQIAAHQESGAAS